jgi:hypothetical protein
MRYVIRHTQEKSFKTIEEARAYRETCTGKVQLIVDQDPFGKHFDINSSSVKEKK